jgi:hypothetical protein
MEKNNGWIKIVVIIIFIVLEIFIFFKLEETRMRIPISDPVPVFEITEGMEFTDGLENPVSVHKFAPDEFGEGVVEVATFSYDIDGDGRPDKISRARRETGTAHFQYIYKVELNNGEKLINITPKDFFTVEGAECAHQKIQFSFKPDFSITKISRPMGEDWDTPTQSTKTVYTLWNNNLHIAETLEYKTVCDVAELF